MTKAILRSEPLTSPWAGTDPFLFCAHHQDSYPASDGDQGVRAQDLGGRPLGNDFSRRDHFSMYYGERVPGFPAHPHRGFETVTLVTSGVVDHSDSLGATARYGEGDVQWLTAGAGIMHAEMFPLRHADEPNPFHLFQIWLNLPARSKMVDPAFVVLWDKTMPRFRHQQDHQAYAEVKVIAGTYQPQDGAAPHTPLVAPAATPDSWASNPEADFALWYITLTPGAELLLPPAINTATRRTLYFFAGDALQVDGDNQPAARLIEVVAKMPLLLRNPGEQNAEIMLMQAVPIGEPVVAQGPFVMNTQAEIDQARYDFGRTRFGGWPWDSAGPVHAAEQARFARYPGSDHLDIPQE